jgi:hypothetical protein
MWSRWPPLVLYLTLKKRARTGLQKVTSVLPLATICTSSCSSHSAFTTKQGFQLSRCIAKPLHYYAAPGKTLKGLRDLGMLTGFDPLKVLVTNQKVIFSDPDPVFFNGRIRIRSKMDQIRQH